MEILDKAYEAIDILSSINIPISSEQKLIIARLEKEFLREELMPLFKRKMQPLVQNMRNNFELEVTFS